VVFGIVAFFRGFQIRTKRKLIENIPTSTVRGLAMGLVEVKGKARQFQDLLTSDFARATCVFYHYKVEEYRNSGRSGHWVTLAEYSSPQCFYLEDETGKVLVDPARAEFHVHPDRRYSSGLGGKDKADFFTALEALGIEAKNFIGFEKSLRCEEAYIVPGDDLYVLGTARENPYVSGSATGSDNVCIGAEAGNVFLISDESEKHVLGEFGGRMFLALYGGPALTVVCLFILIGHFFKHMF